MGICIEYEVGFNGFKLLVPNFIFLYPLETENCKVTITFLNVFIGYRNLTLEINELVYFCALFRNIKKSEEKVDAIKKDIEENDSAIKNIEEVGIS